MSLAWMMVLIFLGVGLLLLAPMAVLYLIVRRFFGEGSDWSRLGRSFPAPSPPPRLDFFRQTLAVGPVYYGNRVNVAITAQGLYLERPGIIRLPPLLIPWAQIKQVREAAGLWRRRMVLSIGQPHITTIWLPMHVFARVQPYLRLGCP
jgi:hypothetical protein